MHGKSRSAQVGLKLRIENPDVAESLRMGAGFNSADGMNYPQLGSEDSLNVECLGELPPSCICLYIIVYIVYHIGSRYRH